MNTTCRVPQPLKPLGQLFGFVEGAVELVGRGDCPDGVEELAHLAAPGVERGSGLTGGEERRRETHRVGAPGTADAGGRGLRGPLEFVCNEESVKILATRLLSCTLDDVDELRRSVRRDEVLDLLETLSQYQSDVGWQIIDPEITCHQVRSKPEDTDLDLRP